MDSLEIDGKEYISAKRAAREHSYTTDYIGQLIRAGKLVGRKVGRAWYVEVDSLHFFLNPLETGHVAETVPTTEGVEQEAYVEEVVPADVSAETSAHTEEELEVAETLVPYEAVSPHIEETVPQAPVALHQAPQREEARTIYNYPMLNYVSETNKEEIIPKLGGTEERSVHITKASESVREAPSLKEEYSDSSNRHSQYEIEGARSLSSYVPRLPALRALPALLGGAVAVSIIGLILASTLFEKTLTYSSDASSVSEAVSYSNFFTKSR